MKLFASFFLLLCFLSSAAQVEIPQKQPKETFSFTKERALIPGETMGQKMESLLFWSVKDKERRFPNMHLIFPSVTVLNNENVYPLQRELSDYKLPKDWIEDYITRNNVGGLIVLKNDSIILEEYGQGVDPKTIWTSFSVGKSVTSMLLGAALKDGFVESLDDPLSKYIFGLKGTDYGKVTVRQLLTMTSGMAWNEDYADPNSDVAQMYLQPCEGDEAHILTYMKNLKSAHVPDNTFNYSTGETDLLGILVQKATGQTLAHYLSKKIWQPWGMEENAYWLADECSMSNLGGSGLSATLRDYGRLGTVMLKHGKKDGLDIFAPEWLQHATSLIIPIGDDGSGYGYLWWRFPNGSYAAFGIFGQMIYINPREKIVIAQYAAWPQAGSKELSADRAEMIKKIERAVLD